MDAKNVGAGFDAGERGVLVEVLKIVEGERCESGGKREKCESEEDETAQSELTLAVEIQSSCRFGQVGEAQDREYRVDW